MILEVAIFLGILAAGLTAYARWKDQSDMGPFDWLEVMMAFAIVALCTITVILCAKELDSKPRKPSMAGGVK